MKKYLLTIVLLILVCGLTSVAYAQKLDHVQGQLLVMFEKDADLKAIKRSLRTFESQKTQIEFIEQISIPLNIWKLRFDFTKINEIRLLAYFEKHEEVFAVQFNHFMEQRARPNDPDYDRQWHFFNGGQTGGTFGVDLDIEPVWDITTGGLSPNGDTVVVCVLDDGLDPTHQDFEGNLWFNYAEIPGNGLDDDNNGFVDDFRGWNAFRDNDDIDDINVHGTPVAGVIGARGNNGRGGNGVAWNIKLMIVSGGANTEAENIQAFSYSLTQRMRYNETAGREGAYVVATNFSQGVEVPDGVGEDFPLWCALLDAMGEQGILTVAAPPNDEIDIDVVQDYPGNCASEYLIMVTSADANGAYAGRGFGIQNVDMAAFGENIWTTTNLNSYGYETGTSFATPLVAGAIALLYTSPCLSLSAISDSDPSGAALVVRDLIFDGVVSDPSLINRTLTGGYLNVKNTIDLYLDNCSTCTPPTSLANVNTTDRSTALEWKINDSINRVDLRIRRVGTEAWQLAENVSSGVCFEDLLPCSSYEVQLKAFCSDQTIDFNNSFFFETDGCCEAPDDVTFLLNGESRVLIGWTPKLAARSYNIRYRIQGETDWETLITTEATTFIEGLQACTPYEAQVQTNCDTLLTDFSASLLFETIGCGSCTDLEYCVIRNASNTGEWIEEVQIGDFVNKSGQGAEDFTEFTDLEGPTLVVDSTYDLVLIPGFNGRAFGQYFRIWIDYNQDGFFTSGEEAFDAGGTVRDTLRGMLSIPSDALEGRTRMRVIMNFNSAPGPCSLSGGSNSNPGEAEDYCVNIVKTSIPCCAPTTVNVIDNMEQTITFGWEDQSCGATAHILRYRKAGETEWLNDFSETTSLTITGLESCTDYEVQIQGLCGADFSDFSATSIVSTSCPTNTIDNLKNSLNLKFFPNPVKEQLQISLVNDRAQQLSIRLINLSGQTMITQNHTLGSGFQRLSLDVSSMPAGVYLLKVNLEEGEIVERIIIN